MSNITLSSAFANALAAHDATAAQSSVADQIGGGSLVIYGAGSGTPAGANESLDSNAVLATFTLSAASAQSSAAGVISLAFSATTVTAASTGTATFFRILSSGSTSLIQGLISTSGADFNLSSTAITSGDNVSITGTPTLTVPVT